MKLGVGVIGLGPAWEKRHRSALRALSDQFHVRAVCEQVVHRAETAAHEFDADTMDGYQALIRRPDIDAVLIFSSQWYGALPVLAACDKAKSIYCAAAFDMQLHGAQQVVRRARDSAVTFTVEFPRRLAPATIRLKELIATQLGTPHLLFCHSRIPHDPKSEHPDELVRRELLKALDWCQYIVGSNAKAVVANGRPGTTGSGGYRVLSVDFDAGDLSVAPLAQISCGNYLPQHWLEASSFRQPASLQVRCENGVAFLDLPSTVVWFNEAGRHVESLEAESPIGEQLLRQFHRSVLAKDTSLTDLESVCHTLELAALAESP